MKCSKPGCPCATDPDARHGPYLSIAKEMMAVPHALLEAQGFEK